MTGRLHGAVTSHPHWAAFDAEEAKAHRLMAKAGEHDRQTAAERREWESATARWEAEREAAAMEGREPDESVPYPGEWVEPRRLLGRRNPAATAHGKLSEVAEMRRSWARRMAPELVAGLTAADDAALGELSRHLDGARAAAADASLARESMGWIAACGGDAPLAGDLFEVQNLLGALGDAVGRLRRAAESPTPSAFPSNLDAVDIG